uniref:Putative major capsid protein n=1 Tax=viral metagenome TaxID=1070528 RepID=A0A6M3K7R1_9ZZZZ
MPLTAVGGVYTLLDLIKMLDPSNGQLLFVAETLARKNPIVREVPIMEANQALTHIGSRQSSLPTVQKRAINDGVPKSAHKEIPVTAPMSLFETMSQVDEELLRLAGTNAGAVRQRKDAAFIEAMAQAVADEIFFGSIADDVLGFNGLTTMFNSSTTYPNGDSSWYYNVLKAGGAGGCTSVWIIEWGPEKAHLIYPKNTVGGIEIQDLGKQLVAGVTASTEFVAYVTQFKWRCGLFVADERCVQRLCNIERTGVANIWSDDDMITLMNQLPDMGENPNTRIYCNRQIRTQMDIRLKDKNNVNYTSSDQPFGPPVMRFRGVPVQVCDALNTAEADVA